MSALRRVEPVRAWDERDATTVLARDGRALRFEAESAGLVREVLAFLATPASRDALDAHLAARAELPRDALPREPVDALLALLIRHGVITQSPAPQRISSACRRVLVGVSGAVAAVDAPAVVRLLQARGHEVRVALTRSARRFVSSRALEALTHARAHRGLWDASPGEPSPHVALASWAELVVVYPCTATTLARLATGDCSDLVAATWTASPAPKVIAPSMNAEMLQSAAVQRNLSALRGDGVWIAHPAVGHEVARAPHARRDMLGPALPPQAFVEVVAQRLAGLPPPTDWDAHYRGDVALPWAIERDELLASLLRAHAPPTTHPRLIDLGTGTGALALDLAAAGYAVTAIDMSPNAIERAAARDVGGVVTWVVDDVTDARVRGRFDAAHDRGCLHALDAVQRARYVAQVAAWLRPGGVWVVKAHEASAPACGTARFTPEALDGEAGSAFERVEMVRCDFGGPVDRPALAAVYRRR